MAQFESLIGANKRNSVLLAVVFVLFACAFGPPHVAAQIPRQAIPDPGEDYDWKEIAQKWGLGEKNIQTLAAQKVLMTNEPYKQIFVPYIASDMPLFITADSLLNAFHVLYEESVVRLEETNAAKLPRLLKLTWNNLKEADKRFKGKPELVARAKQRAQIVIGTALRLLGDESIKPAPNLAALIEKEVEKVVEAKVLPAEARTKPEWLGPWDADVMALDYSRYKPRGFYTKSENLKRYFRAVAWLQSIPFRVAEDEELVSLMMLVWAIRSSPSGDGTVDKWDWWRFMQAYSAFIGVGDDWDLQEADEAIPQWRWERTGVNLEGEDLHKCREALAEWARRHGNLSQISDQLALPPPDPALVAAPNFRILSAYRTPDAILFQRTTDWRRFPGPNPRLFPTGLEVAMALGSSYARSKLTYQDREKLLRTIDENKTLFAEGSSLYFMYLDCLAALLDDPEPDAPDFMRAEAWQAKSCQTALAGWAQLRHTWALQAKQTAYYGGMGFTPAGFVEPEPDFFARMADMVEEAQVLLDKAGAFGLNARPVAREIQPLWQRFAHICRRLELLSHKQLRGRPFSDSDNRFLRSYGQQIASVMLYGGNSWLDPHDNAPRVVDVFANTWAQFTDGKRFFLEVGVARPRALFVLYPYKDGEVLCRGAVLPYYEFTCERRLTDTQWQALLDSKQRPATPTWLRPIVTSEGITSATPRRIDQMFGGRGE